jgi:hypothetical protein
MHARDPADQRLSLNSEVRGPFASG